MDLEHITSRGFGQRRESRLLQPSRESSDDEGNRRDLPADGLNPDPVPFELGFRAIEIQLQFSELDVVAPEFGDKDSTQTGQIYGGRTIGQEWPRGWTNPKGQADRLLLEI